MTLYLKYRPQTIAELDLTSVREQLQKILTKQGSIPHAFLFAGPRGSGKTSAARILAKAVNCEKPTKAGEPCNKCSQCVAISKGTSLDVIEIDAASNRGVDDIRSLREAVKLATSGAKKKVYIIDEAHMLTTEAGNALLKTLEEPPEHVIFVLATTTPEKLLDTIKSRCTTLHFIKANEREVVCSLERAAEGEKMKLENGVLKEIAKSVDGSFREAHKILEQLSFGGEKITVEDVQRLSLLGVTDPSVLISHLIKKDTKGALDEVLKFTSQGVPLRSYTAEVIGVLRKSLLANLQGEKHDVGLENEDLLRLIELLSEAAKDIPTSVIPQLPLELAVVKWCVGEIEQSRSTRPEVISPPVANTRDVRSSTASSPLKEGELEEKWREIMLRVKSKNHSAEALLRAARPEAFDGKTLCIEVFYKFHKERLESQPFRNIIEEVAGEVLGGTPRLLCGLSEVQKKAADVRNVSEEVEEDIVKAAEDIFGGGSGEILPN